MTLPDGVTVTSDDTRFAELMSTALGRPVTLATAAPSQPSLEEYWPDMVELANQETVTDEAMPAGMFFDLATIHVLHLDPGSLKAGARPTRSTGDDDATHRH